MQHQVGEDPWQISRLNLSIAASYNICAHRRNVCGRGNTIHSHHRMGYDGQDQILSTQHAVLILGQVLPVSSDSDQDSSSGAKAKSHVQWYVYVTSDLFHLFIEEVISSYISTIRFFL